MNIINTGITLVDFWAPWCGPCQMLGPVIEEIEKEMTGKINVQKVNVDEEPALANQYGISSIPAVLIFKDGEVKETLVGFRQKTDYLEAINKIEINN
jgi:thioredoxin 1